MKRVRNTIVPKQSIMIYAATSFEYLYFNQVRKDCRYTNLTVKLSSNPASLEKLIVEAAKARTAGKFDSTWVVFSFADFALKPSDVAPMIEFATAKKVKLAWINPSLSTWIFLHFKAPSAVVLNKEAFEVQLAKSIAGYEETSDFLLGPVGQNLHIKLFANFAKAIQNASLYNRICESSTGLKATTLPDLYGDIQKYCGNADVTHNQKMLSK